MNIRFQNAGVMSMEQDCHVDAGQEVWVSGNRIVYVGAAVAQQELPGKMRECGLPPEGFQRTVDCEGDVLMPGFKDAHAHSAMTIFRSEADDMPLNEWLTKQIFPREAKLTPEDMMVLSKLAILEYVSGGITAVFDMYLMPDAIATAFTQCGMRVVQCGTVNNFTHSAAELEDFFNRLNVPDSLLSYRLGFHAEYTTDKPLLMEIAKLSNRYQAPVFMHLSETEREVRECISRYGMTPPAFLASIGMFEHGGGGYHCVHVTEADMELMHEKKVAVISCPGSNTKLASGIAPLARMQEHQLLIALGTDGAASNNALDMFREMYLAAGLAKLREQDAAGIEPESVLRMATVNGAQVMGLTDCQTITKGQKADMIRIAMKQPNMRPVYQFAKNLVYSGNKSNIRMTMVDGEILYEDGAYHIHCNPQDIYAQVEAIADRVVRDTK